MWIVHLLRRAGRTTLARAQRTIWRSPHVVAILAALCLSAPFSVALSHGVAQAATGGYRLPFAAGTSLPVAQGWGGQGLAPAYQTHNAQPQYYAYDFQMPIGTPVLASNDGQVRFARGDVTSVCYSWSCANTVNYVTLAHPDGSETVYVHLSKVVVSVGQNVRRGDVIGYSGDTGYTSGFAHLHFQRTVASTTTWYPTSEPIYFDEYPGQQLTAPNSYTSQNSSSIAVHTAAALVPGGGASGYVLDGFGGIHAFGAAPAVTSPVSWGTWDIARGIAVRAAGKGYVLDGYGGLHPFGGATPLADPAYWSGWDIARGISLCPGGAGGYVLDGYGGIHSIGNAPAVASIGANGQDPWNWDIARSIVVNSTCNGGYVLDGYGGIHPFGTALAVSGSPYWGWDIARSITLVTNRSGYVLDGYGGVHPFAANGTPMPAGQANHRYDAASTDPFDALVYSARAGSCVAVTRSYSNGLFWAVTT